MDASLDPTAQEVAFSGIHMILWMSVAFGLSLIGLIAGLRARRLTAPPS